MVTESERERAAHLIELLEDLDAAPWPPDPKRVADLCGRSFQMVEKLAQKHDLSLAVCFAPSFKAESAPECQACRCVKGIANLHSAAGADGDEADHARASRAIAMLCKGLASLAGMDRAADPAADPQTAG